MKASVTQLSASTRAVIAFHGSGKVSSLTFVRGREAFVLDDREAKALQAVFEVGVPREEAA